VTVLLLVALMIGLLVLVDRADRQSREQAGPSPQSAIELLGERLARGEVTPEEYRQRRAALMGSGHLSSLT
jgi:uncharacterized membrane protein